MSNNFNNTYQLTVDKTIPFNVSISDIGDDKIYKLWNENIKKLKKKNKKHNRLSLIIVALLYIFMGICTFVPESSQIYHIAAMAVIIFTCLAFIDVIIDIRSGRLFLNIAATNEIKGWNAYQTASKIVSALDNIGPNSEIKLITDVEKSEEPNIYLQIKDNDTKRINTYWLVDFSWDVHNKNEVILIANSTKINDTTSNKPVYEMKLLVPSWIANEYFIYNDLVQQKEKEK